MAYTKQTWATGDTITAQKLNHMEDGIGGAVPLSANTLIATFTFNEESLRFESDTTFQDMVSAYNEMKAILAVVPGVGAIPLASTFDSQDNIVSFDYGNCYTEGEGQQGVIPMMFNHFHVVYDSENEVTIGNYSSLELNLQTSS